MTDEAVKPPDWDKFREAVAAALPYLQPAAERFVEAMTRDPAWESVGTTLQQMGRDNSVDSIGTRQQESMAAILNSFYSDRQRRFAAPPSVTQLVEAEVAVRNALPKTREQAEEIGQLASDISADPKRRKLLN